MDRLFGHRWIYTTVISLTMGTLISGQWPNSLLQSPVRCEFGYNHETCLHDENCMRDFITCQCIPEEVLEVLQTDNELPLDSVVLCLYSIYVMEIGEPTCCTSQKRNISPPTMAAPTRNTQWQFMVGRHFPLPSFNQKKQQTSDSATTKTTQITKKSETFRDVLGKLERDLEEEIIAEVIEDVTGDVSKDGRALNNVKDISNAISNVNEDVRYLFYKLLARYVSTTEKKTRAKKQ